MEVFLARQPIFDVQQRVFAYELLSRSGHENFFKNPDGNQATAQVLTNGFIGMGIGEITNGKKAFVNMTQEFLIQEYSNLLPHDLLVVEIMKNVHPDPEIIEVCKNLKQAGYQVVLDDFAFGDGRQPLLGFADIVKVDFLTTRDSEKRALVERLSPRGIRLLAEKVETQEDFHRGVDMGYSHFQGYFFSKPVMLKGKKIPGFKLNYLQIVREINRPDVNLDHVEGIIKRDLALSYKLLRYINSAFFKWNNEIRSIKHALVLMGEKDVKKWASLVALASMGEDKPMELVVTALVRAKFCESLAAKVGLRDWEQDLFLMGMFSLIDAIVDLPLSEILANLPISADIKNALLGETNPFRDVLETVLAYEQGNWTRFSEWSTKLDINQVSVLKLYLEAVDWANQSFQGDGFAQSGGA